MAGRTESRRGFWGCSRTRWVARIAVVTSAALLVSLIGAGAAVTPLTTSANAAGITEDTVFRIKSGTMHYDVTSKLSCTAPGGHCADSEGSTLKETNDSTSTVSFTVHDPGDPVPLQQRMFAHLNIDAQTLTSTQSVTFKNAACGGTVTDKNTARDLVPSDVNNPSIFDAAVDVLADPNTERGFKLALSPPEGTEPRYGWEYPIGLHYTDSNHYPTVTIDLDRSASDTTCNTTATREASVTPDISLNPWPSSLFDIGREFYAGPADYGTTVCGFNDIVCTTPVSGVSGFHLTTAANGDTVSGGVDVTWSFVVEAITCSSSADADADGLTDCEEFTWQTKPDVPDTDGDGLSDGDEVHTYRTIPTDPDSDDDKLSDGDEVNRTATEPLDFDTDDDTVMDGEDNCPLEKGAKANHGCPASDCKAEWKKSGKKVVTTVTELPGPDIKWFTTTATATVCAPPGDTPYILGMSVDRDVHNGPVPFLINEFGVNSGTETPVAYTPKTPAGARSASGTFNYQTCYDTTKFFDHVGVTKFIRKKLEVQLRRGFVKIFAKAGKVTLTPALRRKVKKEVFARLDHLFATGTIRTKVRSVGVPYRAADLIEKVFHNKLKDKKVDLKTYLGGALATGKWDKFNAHLLADSIVKATLGRIDRYTNFCFAGTSYLRTAEGVFDVAATSDGPEISFVGLNLHPLMRWHQE